MGFSKIMVVTVALVALGGFGVAAVAPQALVGQEQEPLSFTVPLSRVGDRVVYESYSESDTHSHRDGHDLVRSRAYELVQLDAKLDWQGNERDVVVVASSYADIHPDTQSQTAPAAGPVHYVDRTERTSIGIHWFNSENGQLGHNVSLMRPGAAPIPYLEMQGLTLGTGQTVMLQPTFTPVSYGFGGGAGAVAGNTLPDPLDVPEPSHRALSFRLNNDVSEIGREPAREVTLDKRAVIDGQEAIGFTLTDSGDVAPGHDPNHLHPAWDHGTPASWTNAETIWFTDSTPYPVLIEITREIRDSSGNAFWWANGTRWLAEYTPGPGGEAWGPSHARDPHIAQRSDNGHIPADGTGSSIAYPLSTALADTSLVPAPEWLLWWQQHPDARLVAATMTPGSHSTNDLATLEWRLTFADPTGEAIQVLTERSGLEGVLYQEVMAQFETDAIADAALPSNLVTLGQIEAYWRHLEPEAPVTFVHWGLRGITSESSRSCLLGASSSASDDLAPLEQMRRVQLGSTNVGPCLSDDDVGLLGGVVADLDRGHLLGSFSVSHAWNDPHGPSSAGNGPSTPLMQPSDSRGLPTIVLSSLASSSLLVIIITVYLLPHIKWFGTQALLFVPGFSKLKKDRLLDHKLRERLNETIKANPGISPSELQRQTGAGWGTIVHHLTIMEKNGLVTSAVDGRHRRYFPHLPGGETAARREAVLGNDNTQRVLSLIMAEPGIPTSAIANELGMSTAGAMWHLGRLTEAGFVDRRKEGRSVRYFPDQPPMSPARPYYDPKEAVEVV